MYFDQSTILCLNGQFLKATDVNTDLYGQTLHYGYGVFEGIRAYMTENGVKIFKAEEHYERLKRSAELINIPFAYSLKDLIAQTYQVLSLNNLTDAYIRPLVYCSPNMSLSRPIEVNLVITAWKWGAYLGDKRLNLLISSYCRPHPRSVKVEAKVCGHYVNSILATTEAKDKGFDEGLLLDCDGYLAEGPGSNLFFEKNNVLYTPERGNILPGITRATVIEICKELNIELVEGKFLPSQLLSADGAFLCGTAAEVIGIDSVDGVTFAKTWEESIGATIQKAYKAKVLEKTLAFAY